jgi:hypothetical protein
MEHIVVNNDVSDRTVDSGKWSDRVVAVGRQVTSYEMPSLWENGATVHHDILGGKVSRGVIMSIKTLRSIELVVLVWNKVRMHKVHPLPD